VEEDFNSEVLWCGADVLNQVMTIMTAIQSQRFILVIDSAWANRYYFVWWRWWRPSASSNSQTLIYITMCLILFLVTRIHLSSSLCYFSTFPSPVLHAHLRWEQVPPEPLPAEGPARDSGAIRFLGSVFTWLLAQNRDLFTSVLFTIRPCAPTPSVDIAARTSSYDYFLKLWASTSQWVWLLHQQVQPLGCSIDYFLKLCDYFLDRLLPEAMRLLQQLCDYFLDQLLCEAMRLLQQLCDYFLTKYDHSVSRSTTSTTRTTTSWRQSALHRIRSITSSRPVEHVCSSRWCFGTGPTLGYSLILLFLIKFILTSNTCTCLVSLIIIMKLLISCMCNFRIKMYPKCLFI
jgi:hypothetical protein